MARKKTQADEMYNIRRRARRAALRLEEQAARESNKRRKEVALKRAKELRETVRQTYRRKGVTKADRTSATYRLVEMTPMSSKQVTGKAQARRNKAFEHEISQALRGGVTRLSKDRDIARAMALIFMHAHTDIRREQFDNHTPERIMSEIMAAHGTTDLREAFMQTMRENRDTLIMMSQEIKGEAGDAGDSKYDQIAPYLAFVHNQPRYIL